MNKPNLAEINQAFFLCEGSFEKDALNWIIEENRLIYSKDQIDLSYINYRSKKKEMVCQGTIALFQLTASTVFALA